MRAAFGDCPRELLRAAWAEMPALEVEAVEREVLAICTARSEAIGRFLDAQAKLDGALGLVRATSRIAAAPVPDARVERLRGEVAGLRDRIALLEGGPERPETEATLADLRDDLAAAEADLALIEDPGAIAASEPEDVPPPVMEEATAEAATTEATAEAVADEDPPVSGPAGPPAAADGSGQAPLPPARLVGWRVIHAARADGGPWRVLLQAEREEAAFPTVPDLVAGVAVAAEVAPGPRWFTVLDPPMAVSVGETLPDGLTLLAVTAEGIELGDPDAPDAEPVLVPFATVGDSDPGALEWEFATITKEEG